MINDLHYWTVSSACWSGMAWAVIARQEEAVRWHLATEKQAGGSAGDAVAGEKRI